MPGGVVGGTVTGGTIALPSAISCGSGVAPTELSLV
jgi:hypothetical protein